MTYDVPDGGPRWKGRLIKNADAASFEVLTDALARDAARIYMLGMPARVDADSFQLLSPGYAQDRHGVLHVMKTKLKPVKGADPASFEPVGDQFGRDAANGFFRDKRLRLSKGGRLDRLTAFGHVYAHDGSALFFTTRQVAPPGRAEIDWAAVRLRWLYEDGYDVNLPPLLFFDGRRTWYARRFPDAESWALLEGAQFDALSAVSGCPEEDATYLRDARHVWFEDGRRVEGAAPERVAHHGHITLRQGNRLWVGPRALDLDAERATFVMSHSSGPPHHHNGDLLHLGDRICVVDPGKGALEIARAEPETRTLDEVAVAALRPILRRHFTVLEQFLPIIDSPGDIARRMDPDEYQYRNDPPIEWVEPPDHAVAVSAAGEIELTLPDGTVLSRPASCWYTLSCHLWCHARGIEPELIPFTAAGTMLPSGMEMHRMLTWEDRIGLWRLAAALFRAGFEKDARVLGHDLFDREARLLSSRPQEGLISEIASLPRELAGAFRHDRPSHGFESTTNLAVARHIVENGWLDAEDFRDRLDVLDVLHGTMIETNQRRHFLREIVPEVMARYDGEALGHVRERMAFVLEAACIAAQVDVEVNRVFASERLLSIVDFCLARGIHIRFNRARRVETLWALDRCEEGDEEARALVDRYGDRTSWPGVYAHRPAYHTTRLWLLGARSRVGWRPAEPTSREGTVEVYRMRLREMQAEMKALIAEYGEASTKWEEVERIQQDLQQYAQGIAGTR